MSLFEDLHDQAMHHALLAEKAKAEGEADRSLQHLELAFQAEAKAAASVESIPSAEPMRAMLHRSAAALALDCRKYEKAIEFALSGIAGNPSADIFNELKEIHRKASSKRAEDLHQPSSPIPERGGADQEF